MHLTSMNYQREDLLDVLIRIREIFKKQLEPVVDFYSIKKPTWIHESMMHARVGMMPNSV